MAALPRAGSSSKEDEGEDDKVTKTQKHTVKVAAAMGGEYTTLPYPTVIDSGVAKSLLPSAWYPLLPKHMVTSALVKRFFSNSGYT